MNSAPEFTLHCDDCHHEVDIQGKLTAEHIGTPCPVCGSDMLTEADFNTGRRMRFVLAILAFFGLAKRVDRDAPVPSGMSKIEWHAHEGTMKVTRL
ncbi:MAG: hypothetical protein DI537_14495 [Stutzerimonas stutzeri]|nr:MAG: hypothetical protein DI537_14495 [Stutzerimonas stutzeri]